MYVSSFLFCVFVNVSMRKRQRPEKQRETDRRESLVCESGLCFISANGLSSTPHTQSSRSSQINNDVGMLSKLQDENVFSHKHTPRSEQVLTEAISAVRRRSHYRHGQ